MRNTLCRIPARNGEFTGQSQTNCMIGAERMSRGVSDQASDELLRLIKVATPEEHGGRMDQGVYTDSPGDRV